jgi:hypothetical protein
VDDEKVDVVVAAPLSARFMLCRIGTYGLAALTSTVLFRSSC